MINMGKLSEIALAYVGKSKSELNVCDGAWCASFASLIMRLAECYKANDISSISCNNMFWAMEKHGYKNITAHPEADSIIFFDWDFVKEEKPRDHVGIVVSVHDNIIDYVNGNGNDSNRVTRQSIPINSRYITEIMKEPNAVTNAGYKNINDTYIIKKGMSGGLVRVVQSVVGAKVDGMFGNDTDKLVKAFQSKHGLTADGEVGVNTWTKIAEVIKV